MGIFAIPNTAIRVDSTASRGDQLQQLAARYVWPNQLGFAERVDAMHGENILGQIDADEYDCHGLPLATELMRVRTSHRGTLMPVAAKRLGRDGEVPFIR